jgi:hypothetical protein
VAAVAVQVHAVLVVAADYRSYRLLVCKKGFSCLNRKSPFLRLVFLQFSCQSLDKYLVELIFLSV